MNFKKFKKPYIIAEIGINHEGELKIAKKLIIQAKKSGADAVKFQVFNPKTLAIKKLKKSNFQKKNVGNTSLEKLWNKLKLNFGELIILKKLAVKLNIDFICTAFDFESLEIVKKLNVAAIKIASSDMTDIPLIKKISKVKKSVILSTGMSETKEISASLNILKQRNVALLHCVSMYPCEYKNANLKRIISLKKSFKNIVIGYSDHCKDITASLLAINLGASIVEKHFTLNKNKIGLDHSLSADPQDLKMICDYAKNFKKTLGKEAILPTNTEIKLRKLFRKGIYARYEIKKNQIIKEKDLIIRRPENSAKPADYFKILGMKSKKIFFENDEIKLNLLKKK